MINRIIITHPHPLNAPGGGTRSCLQMISYLEKQGVEVIVIPVVPEDIQYDKQEALVSNSVQVVTVPKSSTHYLLTGIDVAKAVRNIIEKTPVDAVISWEYEGAFLPQLLKSYPIVFGMIAAMPSYSEWMNRKTEFKLIKQQFDDWFRWRLFRSADVVFTSSKFTEEELIQLFHVSQDRIKITARGIDDVFSQVKRQFSGGVTKLIFYGSFAPIKGVFDVIDALGKLVDKGYYNWQLKLAGWGNEDDLNQALQRNGISQQTIVLGCLNREELAKELEAADLAILPSRAESFGRAIAEAQAAGLGVVSYDTGSIPEVVQSGITALLVPPGDTKELAEAILTMMHTPEKTYQMGLAGREYVTQKFSWEKTAQSILEGIEQAKRRKLTVQGAFIK